MLLEEEKALVNGKTCKPSLKLKGGETITMLGDPAPPPLRAMAEDIPLDIIYEDDDLAVINKPAGMMVHAGAGATDDDRNRGTLVNALLHRFAQLSEVGGETRPGIVHRLDKETSGLILVARNDVAHRNLAKQFSGREVKKRYIALVHGWPERPRGTITAEISRDAIRRIRMTTRGSGGRTAVTHYEVRERIESPYGKFALVDVRIETGRTHQIRVHMASIGHPVVGDTLYGAAGVLRSSGAPRKGSQKRNAAERETTDAVPDCAAGRASPQPQLPPRRRGRVNAPAYRPAAVVYCAASRGTHQLPGEAAPPIADIMKFPMRIRGIVLLLAVFSFASFAQDAGQQPLPSAPSATKYPPKPATTPASASSGANSSASANRACAFQRCFAKCRAAIAIVHSGRDSSPAALEPGNPGHRRSGRHR